MQFRPLQPARWWSDPFHRIITIVCTIAVIRLWLLPVGNSFWLDETLIAWTIRDGFGEIIPRAFISLQSIAFCMVEWLFAQFSMSEVGLRLPSLLAACGTTYLYYRIGIEAADHELGLILATLFIAWPVVAMEVPNARPYALALLFHTAALYWLVTWVRSAHLKHGILWIVCAAAATHFHHLFVSAIPLEALFVLWRMLARDTRISLVHLVFCSAAGVILLLPALPQALVLVNQSQLLSLKQPSWFALLSAVVPVAMLPAPTLLMLLEWSFGRRPRWSAERSGTDVVVLSSLLLAIPVAFFAISRLTSTRIFEARYLLPALPALILLWGWLLRGFETPVRRLSLVVVVVQSLFVVGGPSLVPDYRGEDWRAAVSSLPESGAVVVYPGLVETRNLEWLQAPERWGYLTAPVSAYRGSLSRAETFVLPFEIGLREQAYTEHLVGGLLRSRGPITLIVRRSFYGPAWAQWFTKRLAAAGFRKESESTFLQVELHVFSGRKPEPPRRGLDAKQHAAQGYR